MGSNLISRLKTRLNHPKIYYNSHVYLKEKMHLREDETFDHVASIIYDIYNMDDKKVGSIDLRLTMNEVMFYYGHVGYHIIEKFRGHHYAYHACTILKMIAKEEFDLKELIITCNPDNIASLKTIEKLGAILIGRFEVPLGHDLRKIHENEKMIYKVVL